MSSASKAALLHTLLQLAISAAIVFLEAIGTFLLAPATYDIKLILIQGATLAVFSFINGALHYLRVSNPTLVPLLTTAEPLLANAEEQIWSDLGGKGTLPTGTTGIVPSIGSNPPSVQLPKLP